MRLRQIALSPQMVLTSPAGCVMKCNSAGPCGNWIPLEDNKDEPLGPPGLTAAYDMWPEGRGGTQPDTIQASTGGKR